MQAAPGTTPGATTHKESNTVTDRIKFMWEGANLVSKEFCPRCGVEQVHPDFHDESACTPKPEMDGELLAELVGKLCRNVAGSLDVVIKLMSENGRDPARVGIQVCGMDEEINLRDLRKELTDVASYLPGNGQMYPLPEMQRADYDPWGPPYVS